MSISTIETINNKKVCIKNSFCIHNLTDKCNKCIIKTGSIKYDNLFESGNSKQVDEVLNRIFNN